MNEAKARKLRESKKKKPMMRGGHGKRRQKYEETDTSAGAARK